MIQLRERLRMLDEGDKREESKWERAVEKVWTFDIYGCPSNLEASITEEVLLAFAPDIGDSIAALLFVDAPFFNAHVESTSAVAFAHYSNIVAVKKPTCSTPVHSFDLRRSLVHEIAHVRTFNIHNFEALMPTSERSKTLDKRTFQRKWTTLAGCSHSYVGASWRSLSRTPVGFVRRYGAVDWMEDVATFVEVAQLVAYHRRLDEDALQQVYDVFQGSAAHQQCLRGKLAKANAFRFLDDETADLVRAVWESSNPTARRFRTRLQALREKIHMRNREGLEGR